jgi:transcription termination factor NusB
MYGLESNDEKRFEMDLEKDLKKDHNYARQLLKQTDEKVFEIKTLISKGTVGPESEDLGRLLLGYVSFQKIINKIINKK